MRKDGGKWETDVDVFFGLGVEMNNHDSETHTEEEIKTEDESKNDSGNFSDNVKSNSINGNDNEKKLTGDECWQEVAIFPLLGGGREEL